MPDIVVACGQVAPPSLVVYTRVLSQATVVRATHCVSEKQEIASRKLPAGVPSSRTTAPSGPSRTIERMSSCCPPA